MAEAKTVKKVESDSPKSFVVMKIDGTSLLKIGLEGGGVVPKELSETLYTSARVAEHAIQGYLEKRGK